MEPTTVYQIDHTRLDDIQLIPRILSRFTKLLNSLNASDWFGIIHLVRTQNFPKNEHFLPPDTHASIRTKWTIPFHMMATLTFKELMYRKYSNQSSGTYLSKSGVGGLFGKSGRLLIGVTFLCSKKKKIQKQNTFINANIFQKVIYETILIRQHLQINNQMKI